MAIPEVRRLRNRMAGVVREYEGHLLRLEDRLRVLRGKAERAGEDVQAHLAGVLAQTEQEMEAARELGRTALGGLERAADAARTCLADLKSRLDDVEAGRQGPWPGGGPSSAGRRSKRRPSGTGCASVCGWPGGSRGGQKQRRRDENREGAGARRTCPVPSGWCRNTGWTAL